MAHVETEAQRGYLPSRLEARAEEVGICLLLLCPYVAPNHQSPIFLYYSCQPWVPLNPLCTQAAWSPL